MVSHIKNEFGWKQKGKANLRTKIFCFIKNVYARINTSNSAGIISVYTAEEKAKDRYTKAEQEKAKIRVHAQETKLSIVQSSH